MPLTRYSRVGTNLTQLFFWEDFTGNTIDSTLWSSGGSAGSVFIQEGSILRIRADANDDYYQLEQIAITSVAGFVTCNYRCRLSSLQNIKAQMGFIGETWTEWAVILYDDSTDTNFWCQSVFNSISSTVDSGIAADTAFHEFKIETFPGGIKYYIDGIYVTTISTNNPTALLKLYAYVTSMTGNSKDLLIDSIKVTCNLET
jgi:hypothetical protein